ncbi:colicin transporter [Winslowiella iniecta]|uniref:Colicin transporter n=1 Tax=Winslowiella iniecta TaxID=1560201 RepID=A0A0L7T0T2_9GAMM|nr:colicin transporter [Winslowiella iniecta]KOC88997.1 colicin transporter [Winslowiella iniecta]KOC92644.1 colicin transporter [Winslowiella iniecta]
MKLTAKAAKEVCAEATTRNVFIGRIEAGHWLNSGFRPDGNATWDAKSELESAGRFQQNNQLAIKNIADDKREGYNTFIITTVR